MLEAHFCKELPDFTLRVDLLVDTEEILVLSGPSGSGKTTILECLAGLRKPNYGEISLNGRILFSSVGKINIPPYRRGIGYIFQHYALFQHMTVKDNVQYGLKKDGRDKSRKIDEAMARFGILHLAGRYPHQLSGGEKQRVALARALLSEPSLLLLDEPLSALDRSLRETLRQQLKELHQAWKVPFVLVTHSRCEEQLANQVLHPLQVPGGMNWGLSLQNQ